MLHSTYSWVKWLFLSSCFIKLNFSTASTKTCEFAPGLTVGNRGKEMKCCNATYQHFSRVWASGTQYLSTLLESLKGWNCSQFYQECQSPTFAYNNFTRLMYDRFCNSTKLEQQCFGKIRSLVKEQRNTSIDPSTWQEAVSHLDVLQVHGEDLIDPCIQIAMYEVDSGGYGHYHEVVGAVLPFCPFIWCGFDENVVESKDISIWTCMPKTCRTSITVIMVVCGILGVAVIICNATILAVFGFNRFLLWNGQAVYRLSLAAADILAGIIVFPTFISSLYKLTLLPHELGALRNISGFMLEDGNLSTIHSVELRGTGGLFHNRFSRSYLDAVGIFTILTLCVSVLTLVAAGIDRFVAVSKPLKYQQKSAKRIAQIVAIIIWIGGWIFSTLPLYVHDLRYGLVASILVSSAGNAVVILYAFAFIIPLLIMWSISIATFFTSRKYIRECNALPIMEPRKRQGAVEMRLVKTLGIMVGVFTLCILPSVIVLLIPLFLSNIYYNDPVNLNPNSAVSYTSVEVVVLILLMSNSLWNCFIYGTRDEKFRGAAAEMYFQLAHTLKLNNLWKRLGGTWTGLPENQHISHRLSNGSDAQVSETEATRVINMRANIEINDTTPL